MYGFILTLHLLVCLGLVAVVLVQSGKGGGLAGGAFGGTAQTVFGGRGATDFITRATMVLGGAFFVTSLVLALLSSRTAGGNRSLIQEQAKQSGPAVPAPQQVPPSGAAPRTGAGTILPPGAAAPSGAAPTKAPAAAPAPAPATKPTGGGK
jgi:preprotein translocase subunit SecG